VGISIPPSSSSEAGVRQQQQQLVATGAPSLTPPPIRRSDFDRAEAQRIQEFKKGEDARRKQFEDDQRRRRFEFNQQLQQMEKHLDTAYSILGMSPSQDFTMEELKRAYKKAALRHHPDRPHGNAELFQLVTKSFMLLAEKYKKEFHQSKTFEEMVSERGREQHGGTGAAGATAVPPQQDRFTIGSGERFDAARFNKIYAENRLYDINDEGYGDWLSSQEQQRQQHEDPAIFSEKFNLNVFNVMFDNMKRDDPGAQAALVKVETPQALQVREDNGKFGMLGQDNVADFSGYTSNLNYSDLKQAHTNTRLIDANGLQYKEYRNLDEFQKHRESTSFEITDDDRAAQDRIAAEQQREEKRRKKQVAINDRMYEEHHQRVQQRFITK
jgi:curved DNA-binding protein CbpA